MTNSAEHLGVPDNALTPSPSAIPGLEELRRDIDAVDEQIVALLAKRHLTVQRVVALKTAHRLPVYHPSREEDLISQRRDQAVRAGLDPDHIEELYRSIVRHSRVRQTVQVSRVPVRPGGRVLLVGAGGKMGRYFTEWFTSTGYEVRQLEREDWPQAGQLCLGIDAALVSVPIDLTVPVIAQLGPHLPPECVLADITSVKAAPLDAMLAAHAGPVVGLHPLFGPATHTMDKQLVVASPGRAPEACQWLLDQFVAWGNIVVPVDARQHDHLMTFVQALRHFATFAFGDFLCRQQIDLPATLELSSPIYRLEMGMIGRLFGQDPELYAEIIFATPERRALLRDFVLSLQQHCELLEVADKEAFAERFRRVTEWFGPFCGQAMRESSYLIEKLVERF
jgi:chorismate mutase / prephenate dehydrogenase